MKTRFFLIFIFLTGFFSFSSGQDFWREIHIADEAIPRRIDFDANGYTFLLNTNSIFRSSDDGDTWIDLNLNLIDSYNKDIEITSEGTVYVGTDPDGYLFTSNDLGVSWDSVETTVQGAIVLRLVNNDSIFLIGEWEGIFKSIDYGINWNQVLFGSTEDIFKDILQKDEVLFSGSTNFMGSQYGGIYHSLDTGSSWQNISLTGSGISSLEIDSDNHLLCGINFRYNFKEYGVFRSIDNGFTWDNILSGHLVTCLAVDANGGIYAGCDSDFGPEGVQFSSDNGLSWSSLNDGLHENSSLISLEISPNGFIYAITQFPNKVYRSNNPIVSIDEQKYNVSKISVFPNPFRNQLYIDIANTDMQSKDATLKIYNTCGTVVFNRVLSISDSPNHLVDLSHLERGIYFLTVYCRTNIIHQPIIKN